MHITRYTDYSLRVLIYLALKEDGLATIREIAERYAISRSHLMKVVQDLHNKGYILALRGKNGGLRLNGNPETINLGKLIRDTEPDMTIVECFNQNDACVIAPSCHLKTVFREALEAFLAVLDQYTLADLLSANESANLMRLLKIS